MKVKELDDSHRSLLEHLETFRKMMTSYEEIRDYVNDVLQELARDLNQQQLGVNFDPKTIPRGWLEASDIPKWKRTEHALVTIGLEGLERGLGAIVGSSVVDQCQAYVYSPYCDSTKEDTVVIELRGKLRPPAGFVAATQRGYVFTKDLDELPVEDFCDRQKLMTYFSEPLKLLIGWLTNNKETLRQSAERARKQPATISGPGWPFAPVAIEKLKRS